MDDKTAQKALENIILKKQISDESDLKYSLKWVEEVLKWILFTVATGIGTLIIANYIIGYIHLPVK